MPICQDGSLPEIHQSTYSSACNTGDKQSKVSEEAWRNFAGDKMKIKHSGEYPDCYWHRKRK